MWDHRLPEATLGAIYFILFTLHIKNQMPGEERAISMVTGWLVTEPSTEPWSLDSVFSALLSIPHGLLQCKGSQPGTNLPPRRQSLETVSIIRT